MYLRDIKKLSNITCLEILVFVEVSSNVPAKMLFACSGGNVTENIRKTSATLNALPVITNVVLVPAAIPRLFWGTEFIIAVRFGDVNIPIPAPIRVSGNKISMKDICSPIPTSIKNPAAESISPNCEKKGDLYLSYIHPAIGARIAKASDTGIKYIPASSGDNDMLGPCR